VSALVIFLAKAPISFALEIDGKVVRRIVGSAPWTLDSNLFCRRIYEFHVGTAQEVLPIEVHFAAPQIEHQSSSSRFLCLHHEQTHMKMLFIIFLSNSAMSKPHATVADIPSFTPPRQVP
jgi:hypothetical protein